MRNEEQGPTSGKWGVGDTVRWDAGVPCRGDAGASQGWGQSRCCHWAPLPQNPSLIRISSSAQNHFSPSSTSSPSASRALGCRWTNIRYI